MTHQGAVAVANRPVRLAWVSTFLHAVAFVTGFALVFALLGSAVGLLGRNLTPVLPVIQRLGAVLLALFGLVTVGFVPWLRNQLAAARDRTANPALVPLIRTLDFVNGLLYTERRLNEVHKVNRNWGYVSSWFMGVSFSAGWVPCVGPILASILFIASDSATAWAGAVLLLIFSLGLGLPFLITGAAFGSLAPLLRRLNRYARIISFASGAFLFFVAYLLWTDQLVALTTSFNALNAWTLALEDAFVETFNLTLRLDASVLAGAPLAFIAGLIGFFSPCVLPLVPAYIGYLSGASLAAARD